MKQQKAYGNESISSLKGADRVRLRPAVIFGSDGLEGCEHAVFEILSNAIDEAREGYGKQILVTRFADHSIEVEDFGRGCPVDWNEKEGRYNWELVFCELYAGGKYQNNTGGDYEFSLGLNGLGSCATLIQEGYVYIAESPLYEITCKDKTWFAYTDAEKTEIVKKLEGRKLSINRSKGLGENDPEMMWMTTMNPATRRLIKVMPEDMERTMQVFDLLLGDNLQGRKDHIAENGYKYLDQLDVS